MSEHLVIALRRREALAWLVGGGHARPAGEVCGFDGEEANLDALSAAIAALRLPRGTPVTFILEPPHGRRKRLVGIPEQTSPAIVRDALNESWERLCAIPRDSVEPGSLQQRDGAWHCDLLRKGLSERLASATLASGLEFRGSVVSHLPADSHEVVLSAARLHSSSGQLNNPLRVARVLRTRVRRQMALLGLLVVSLAGYSALPSAIALAWMPPVAVPSPETRRAAGEVMAAFDSLQRTTAEVARLAEFRSGAQCFSCMLSRLAAGVPDSAQLLSIEADEGATTLVMHADTRTPILATMAAIDGVNQVRAIGPVTRTDVAGEARARAVLHVRWESSKESGGRP